MTSAISKASMSLEELAACELFLDNHREYAADLLSDIEAIRQWHRADSCPETRNGQACSLCELCDDNGLLGATKRVLKIYGEAENHLKQVRASFGEDAPSRGVFNSHTLFTSQLAKTVFLSIDAVGEDLRSYHATWSVRLQSVVASLSPTSPHAIAGSGDSGEDARGNALPLSNMEPGIIGNPRLSGSVPEVTSNSSMFFVLRRCLTSDCDCAANVKFKEDSRGSYASLKAPSPFLGSKKKRKHKAKRSLTANPPGDSKKTNDTLGMLAQAEADVKTNPDARVCDTPSPQGIMPGEHEPSVPAFGAALLTQEIGSFSSPLECEVLIADPRVFRFRRELERTNSARQALMDWCRNWMTSLRLEPQEVHRTRPTNESIMGGAQDLSPESKEVEPQRSRQATGVVVEVLTREPSHGSNETTQEVQSNLQEELKERWLAAQRNRSKGRQRGSIFV